MVPGGLLKYLPPLASATRPRERGQRKSSPKTVRGAPVQCRLSLPRTVHCRARAIPMSLGEMLRTAGMLQRLAFVVV